MAKTPRCIGKDKVRVARGGTHNGGGVYTQTERQQRGRETNRKTDRQTDRQTDKQRQADRQTDGSTECIDKDNKCIDEKTDRWMEREQARDSRTGKTTDLEKRQTLGKTRNRDTAHDTVWRRPIGCLVCIGHFLQKSHIIRGIFAERHLYLMASCASLTPCTGTASTHRDAVT